MDAGFNTDNPAILQMSLARLRERLMRTAQITLEADEESNSAYSDFLSGLGVGLQSFDIDGSVAAFYENDAMENGYFNDFLHGLGGNEVDLSTIPQQNLAYYGHFDNSVAGDPTQYSAAPSALEVYENFEDGITQ